MNNFWSPLSPPPNVKAALDTFESWGAAVRHHLFPAPPTVDLHIHQMAAQSGLNAEEVKYRSPLRKMRSFDSSKLALERSLSLTPQQFFGPCYEVDTDTVVIRGETNDFLNHYFREGQVEMEATAISQLDLDKTYMPASEYVNHGYAQALFEPPYDLHDRNHNHRPVANREVATAFHHLCTALFGDVKALEIYSWPTDCSSRFDAGHYWWGSFFWTVYAPSKNWLVTITASTTD